jgi:hypothetical protein
VSLDRDVAGRRAERGACKGARRIDGGEIRFSFGDEERDLGAAQDDRVAAAGAERSNHLLKVLARFVRELPLDQLSENDVVDTLAIAAVRSFPVNVPGREN